MLYLEIVDEKGKTIEPEELTATGRGMVRQDAKELIEKIDELQSLSQQ